MSTLAWFQGEFEEILDIVLADNPRGVRKSKIKDQLAVRFLEEWELQYARVREYQMMTGHSLPAALQQLADDPGIYFTILVPRLIVPVRIWHPLRGRSLDKWWWWLQTCPLTKYPYRISSEGVLSGSGMVCERKSSDGSEFIAVSGAAVSFRDRWSVHSQPIPARVYSVSKS